MKTRHLLSGCALAAAILAFGFCPPAAADWADYASPKIDSKWFQVDAGSDTNVEVNFGVDSACDLICQVEGETGSVLGTFNVVNGTVITLSGGGTFYLFVWSNNGACNWTATLADFGSAPGVAGGGGGTTGGGGGGSPEMTADCGAEIGHRYGLTSAGDYGIDVYIDESCVPYMSCFTVGPGLKCNINLFVIDSGGYNCATNAYIDDPGLIVVEGCCTEKVIFSCGKDRNGKEWMSGNTTLGPGKYTLMPAGGRNFMGHLNVSVY